MAARRGTRTSPTPNGNTRVTGKEQFFTPRPIADDVVARVVDVVPDAVDRTWFEPAGGTGVVCRCGREAAGVVDIVSFDIEPRHRDVAEATSSRSS